MAKVIKVGLTMGDPSGIGPAIIVKALNLLQPLKQKADLCVIGDAWVLSQAERALGSKIPREHNLRILDLKNVERRGFGFGKLRACFGKASVEYLDKAMDLLITREIDCLVTCPISKQAVRMSGFGFPGHTEYLADCFATQDFAMMLLNNKIRFSLLTAHIPLKDVSSILKKKEIYRNIALTSRSLKKIFLIRNPSIVVCGLNPHASDNGLMGQEEQSVIRPAVTQAREKLKVAVDGPISSDIAIAKAAKGEYDAVIAVYHDQALIPLKLTGGSSGVNITLGLPFVRTSPLHGTAFDIASKPKLADPRSLIEAVKLAVKCTLNLRKD